MEDNITQTTPMGVVSNKNNDLKTKLTSPTGLGRLSIIFGLLIPPIGLVLAIITIYRAGHLAKRALLFLGLVGLAAVAAGSYGYLKLYDSVLRDKTPTYIYATVEDYKLSGTAEARGMTFKKPAVFKEASATGNSSLQASLAHRKTDSKTGLSHTISVLNATIGTPSGNGPEEAIKLFSAEGQAGDEYKVLKKSFEQYIKFRVNSKFIGTLGAPKAFTNSTIKSNAWQYDFSAPADAGEHSVNGTFVFAVGKSNFYYFSLASLDYNWQANQSSWQQVLDSIKVDQ